MKINTQSKFDKKKVAAISLILVIILVAVGVYAFSQKQSTENSKSNSQPSLSDKQQAEDLAKNPDNKQTQPNTDVPQQPTASTDSNKATVQMSSSVDISNGVLYIRGGVNNAVVTEGTCYAILTGPSKESIRRDTSLLQNPSTTDCKTISVNLSDLNKGKWSATLHYSSDSMEGTSNESTFTVL